MINTVDAIKTTRDINKMKKALHGRDRLLFVLGVSLGLRVSDLLALKIGDLRGKEYLTLVESKTETTRKRRTHRRIKLSATVKREVAALDGADSDYVFKSQKGANRPITRQHAYRVLNEAAKRAGVNVAVGTHTLRKTFGWQLYAKGFDITRIMEIFGHSTPAMTLKYIGITSDEIDNAYEAIEI